MRRSDLFPPPEACAVAYKEWAGVVGALAEGRQCVLLRKGGIDEGPGGFRPEFPAFWLYPTYVHQAEQGLRIPPPPMPVDAAEVARLGTLAVVAEVAFLDREDALPALAPFHTWTAEAILKRFRYRSPGVWALGVRAYHQMGSFSVPVTPEHAGCKTWVHLDVPLATAALAPSLGDAEFAARMAAFREATSGGCPG